QGVDHAVDRVRECGDLALRLDGELPLEVAVRDRGHHLGDAAYLVRQVAGHEIHVVGQVLPGARDAAHLRLAAELPLGPDLARHARYTGRVRAQLVDHAVDRVLERDDLALHVDGDLLGEVAVGDRGGHRGDVPNLGGQVARHEVHLVGQVLPRAGHALHVR